MAAIGSIRKHGVALMIIIGIALLAFILGDLSQVTRTFSNKNVMAKIDGKSVDQEYRTLYEQTTSLFRLLQNKSSFDENETAQIHETTWRSLIQEKILDKQLAALGLSYNADMIEELKSEMLASLNTQQPNQYMMQFAQALANQIGPEQTMSILSNIEELANNEQGKDLYSAYQAIVRYAALGEKLNRYNALAQNTLYFSNPIAKKLGEDNKSIMASMMMVNPEAPAFKDVKATVSDKEVKDFYNTHKDDLFVVTEQNRDIDVAIFPINPSAADLKAIEDSVRADFAKFSTSDMAQFCTEMNRTVDSTFYKEEDIVLEGLDSILFKSTPVGSVIEPFEYENSRWYFGKVFGAAERPDSIHVALIELPYKNAQNQNETRTRKQAAALADSLKDVITSNQNNIFALQRDYISGERTDSTLWLPERGTIVELYNGLIGTPNGGVYVYKAQGGYLVLQVLERTAPISKRQFVLFDYPIVPSDATISQIKSQATEFAASINNAEELTTKAASKGIQTVKGTGVTPMAATIGQLPNCRDIVSWAFSDDVKKDDISDVINVEKMFFAVASVNNIRKTGTQKLDDVKADIEAMLSAQKRVAAIADKVNKDLASSSMETLATTYSTQVRDSVRLIFAGDMYQNSGVEGKAIGTIFSLPTNKPTAVSGDNMVYVVNVKNVESANPTNELFLEKNMLRNLVVGRDRNESTILNYLVKEAKVLDNRNRFYQN
ncbi:MAG: SurA N-terminal domain-containing protein [Bacteroidales bacterium]|nr:SurA N-terminal domain-containing protein [Bacteroidales bacterium]